MSRTRRYFGWCAHRWWWGGNLGRDHKTGFKPPKWFKRLKARIRRAKEMDAIRTGREPERWKKTNTWDWN